ncbi:MAG TPA: hypothetical protein PKC28_03845 [Bdellovibrionales bacterium]|nr:hypothetical protein [Bdellovibrionales bacterium]
MRILTLVALSVFALSACSTVKTRKQAKAEAETRAAEAEAEYMVPIDEKTLNDSLAELGVDPGSRAGETANLDSPEQEAEAVAPEESPVYQQAAETENPKKEEKTAKNKKKSSRREKR